MFNRDKSVIVSWFCAIAFCSSLLFANFGEAATIYIWKDDNGVRQYADYCPTGENCRVKNVGKRRAAKLLGKTNTSTTDSGTADTSSTDTGTTSSSTDNTTTTSTDSGTYDTTAGTETTVDTDTVADTDTTTTDTTDPTSTDTGPVADGNADLQWDPVADTSLSGYRLFFAAAGTEYQAIDVGNTTTYTMSGLESGKRYYFRVAAYDLSGNQSGFSNEVYKDMP
jgi:hypothetical protein